jgi:hypothetical protein
LPMPYQFPRLAPRPTDRKGERMSDETCTACHSVMEIEDGCTNDDGLCHDCAHDQLAAANERIKELEACLITDLFEIGNNAERIAQLEGLLRDGLDLEHEFNLSSWKERVRELLVGKGKA